MIASLPSALPFIAMRCPMEGETATVSNKVQNVAAVTDWDAFWEYMADTHDWAAMQKRISQEHVRFLAEEGEVPPGIEMQPTNKLSITKR
jgi:hypothetical protein